ncbi:MAG: carboxypeptidase regulatory-like domain-containing protein [Acidobacteria bacterium]|nr:carboxypeptidase regulatory-like domain-containing protein [Acidobacteriota bacterium]
MRRPFLWLCLLFCLMVPTDASPLSELRGVLKDQNGNPIVNLALSLVRTGIQRTLRSDLVGQFVFRNLPPGEYALQIETPTFRNAGSSRVSLKPGATTLMTLVLQQVFDLDSAPSLAKNYETRTILRDRADGRLILRNAPDSSAESGAAAGLFRTNGIVEVYSGSAWGSGNFSAVPGSPYAGMLTNFAYGEDLGGRANYIFAGQLVSGDDSLWRVRNLVRYQPAGSQSVELLLGYTHVAFNAPRLPFFTDPGRLGMESKFMPWAESARTLALGLKHTWNPAEQVSLNYGVEVDRFNAASTRTFVIPELQANWRPWAGASVIARMTSRRTMCDNTLSLPDGRSVELADSLQTRKAAQMLQVGVDRHYEITGSQGFGLTRGELSLFRDQLSGGNTALVWDPAKRSSSVYDLPFQQSVQQGLRAGVSGGSDAVNYAVDYVYGTAVGLDGAAALLKSVGESVRLRRYHAVTGRLQGIIPGIGTVITGVIRVVPGRPLVTIDLFSDTWNVSNQSVNFFLRQVVPFPDLLGFSPRLEALLDLRNMLSQNIGALRTELGEVVLVRNPRTVRGGISLNF